MIRNGKREVNENQWFLRVECCAGPFNMASLGQPFARPSAALVFRRILPFGINFGREFAAANEFLKVANDGAPGDFELA